MITIIECYPDFMKGFSTFTKICFKACHKIANFTLTNIIEYGSIISFLVTYGRTSKQPAMVFYKWITLWIFI